MTSLANIIPIVLAYLLGSISFSYLLVRMLKGIDVRTVGSGNAGATNVLRTAGRGPALLALLLDAGKGALAVAVARALEVSPVVVAAVGFAAVLGHVYPLFFGFRGGKGVATAAGTLGTLIPLATLGALAVFVVVVLVTRYVSLGSILAAFTFPMLALGLELAGWTGQSEADGYRALVAGSSTIAALVVWKHRANLARLIDGQENKIGEKVTLDDGANAESFEEEDAGV